MSARGSRRSSPSTAGTPHQKHKRCGRVYQLVRVGGAAVFSLPWCTIDSRLGGRDEPKESLIQALREALVEAFGESEEAATIMAELTDMGCLPQIEVRVFDPQPECVQPIDGDLFDRDFLRSMMIVPE